MGKIAAVCDGDTKAVKESLEYILPSLQHGLEISFTEGQASISCVVSTVSDW